MIGVIQPIEFAEFVGQGASEELIVSIAASTDDAHEDISTGTVTLAANNLLVGANPQIGMRLLNATVPQGTTIVSAVLDLVSSQNQAGTDITIDGELAADAVTYAAVVNNISSRTYTTATAGPWTTGALTIGQELTSINFAPVVQEIVAQGTWASGNAMAIRLRGGVSGAAGFASFDHATLAAAKLTVRYLQ